MAHVHSPPGGESLDDPTELELSTLPTRRAHDVTLFIQPTVLKYTGSASNQVGDGTIDQTRAHEQWYGLVDLYEEFAKEVHVLNPVAEYRDIDDDSLELTPPWELPDIIFAANQSLPFPDERRVMLSRMGRKDRRDEPCYLQSWYQKNGYETEVMEELREGETFEGMGDAIWHPNRRLLWGGVGIRTTEGVYAELAKRMDTHVISFDIQHEKIETPIFHMDICFSVLDETSVMIIPELFTQDDLAIIYEMWDTVVECPLSEGSPDSGYACNAHCIDGENVIIQEGNDVTEQRLTDAGFEVHPVATGELIKACKGSVFCMKLMVS